MLTNGAYAALGSDGREELSVDLIQDHCRPLPSEGMRDLLMLASVLMSRVVQTNAPSREAANASVELLKELVFAAFNIGREAERQSIWDGAIEA